MNHTERFHCRSLTHFPASYSRRVCVCEHYVIMVMQPESTEPLAAPHGKKEKNHQKLRLLPPSKRRQLGPTVAPARRRGGGSPECSQFSEKRAGFTSTPRDESAKDSEGSAEAVESSAAAAAAGVGTTVCLQTLGRHCVQECLLVDESLFYKPIRIKDQHLNLAC